MKITIRIPTEPYAYAEVEYDSIKEYGEMHPEFAKTMVEVRKKAKQEAINSQPPF